MQKYLFKFTSKSQVDSEYKLSHVRALFELSGSYINVLHTFKFKVCSIYGGIFRKSTSTYSFPLKFSSIFQTVSFET